MYDIGKKLIAVFVSLLLVVPTAAFAIPVSVNRLNNNHIEPLNQADFIRGIYFVATSTTGASTFPYASTTALSATTICLIGDVCRTSWPAASASTFGTTSISALAPLIWDTTLAQMSWTGLATTSQPSSSNVLVSDGASGVFGVATGTVSGSGGVTVTSGRSVLGGSLTVTCTAGSGSATGCIQSADWTVFNNKISSSSLSALTPIFYNSSTGVFSWAGLATTSQPSSSNLLVSNGGAGVYGVATSSMGVTSPITFSGTMGAQVGGAAGSFGCATCALTSLTLTAGTGLAGGGTLAANRTFSLLSYVATSSAETRGQLAYWTSSAGTPAALGSVATGTISATSPVTVTANRYAVGGSAVFAWDFSVANSWTGLQTLANASTTLGSFATAVWIPNSSSQTPTQLGQLAQDTTDNQLKLGTGSATAVFDQRRFLTFTYATTTAWTGTTTLPLGTAPAGLTYTFAQCYTDTGTLNVQLKYNSSTSVTPMLFASSTAGIQTTTANNTPAATNKLSADVGTPASSPTSISCTVTATVTGT